VPLGDLFAAICAGSVTRIWMKWRRYANNSAYESHYASLDKSIPVIEMTFNTDSKYPTRRAYVVKMRGDANADALAGRLENLVTGRQREFASGGELLESIASDLEATLHERPSAAEGK
jgi:hypothetical protein